MTSFQDRGKAQESQFFNKEELAFKAASRRRKLLGLWAADYMHKDDEDALEYALEIVRFGIDNNKDGAVISRIIKDIEEKGLTVEEADVRIKMDELHRQAVMELEKEFQSN
jgi:hypothetical protein